MIFGKLCHIRRQLHRVFNELVRRADSFYVVKKLLLLLKGGKLVAVLRRVLDVQSRRLPIARDRINVLVVFVNIRKIVDALQEVINEPLLNDPATSCYGYLVGLTLRQKSKHFDQSRLNFKRAYLEVLKPCKDELSKVREQSFTKINQETCSKLWNSR